jgi:amino acid adenylation domain-containing protein
MMLFQTDVSRVAPLSALQRAMLRDSLAAGVDGRNFERVEMVLDPALDFREVETAWRAVVAATQALRLEVVYENDEPAGMRNSTVERVLQERDVASGFPSLTDGPPWCCSYEPGFGKWTWVFHHALLDGRSIHRVLAAFLNALRGRTLQTLPLLSHEPPTGAEIAWAAEHHRRAFAGVVKARLDFPLATTGAGAAAIELGDPMIARLRAVAESLDSTAATLVTWAWGQAMLLAQGGEAVAIGQVRAGAPAGDRAGFGMNTVPLVCRRSGQSDLRTVLGDFRSDLFALRAVERVSPEDLPEDLFHEAGGPWSSVLMVEHGTPYHLLENEGTGLLRSLVLHEQPGVSLMASAYLSPALRLVVESADGGAGSGVREILLDLWMDILAGLADGVMRQDLPDGMHARLRQWEEGSPAPPLQHLASDWRRAVATTPEALAVFSAEESLTYRQLAARVEQLAARLEIAGVGSGTVVGVYLQRRFFLAECLLAISRLGAVYLPLDPLLPEQRLRRIVDDARPRLILTDQRAEVPDFGPPLFEADGAGGQPCGAALPADPDSLLALLYTSGSTGTPKGVLLHHGGLVNEAHAILKAAELKPGDRMLQFASPGFDASLEELLATFLSGATLVPRPAEISTDFRLFHEFADRAGVTVLNLTTAWWSAWCSWMVAGNLRIPPRVRLVIIGGERASSASVSAWRRSGGESRVLLNTYGPTETSVVATLYEIRGNEESGDPPIGRPLPGVRARVVDAGGRRLPPGAAGELWLGGVGVGPGYWNNAELTRSFFPECEGERWYRSGDRVCWDAAGNLRFLGRGDDQLKIRGHRVEPQEVVAALEAHPGVAAAHVGVIGPMDEPLLAAWVRWESSPPPAWPAKLSGHLSLLLAPASIPVRWAAVAEFALTERGKTDRRALPEPTLTASEPGGSSAPESPTEKRMAKLWQEILRLEGVGREDSFFDLGGHSLAALRLFSRIASEWGIRLPVALLFQYPTVAALSGHLDRAQSPASGQAVVLPIHGSGPLAPFYCIHGGDGGVIFYRNLSLHFPEERPVYAIESPGLSADGQVSVIPIPEVAARYISALRRHQAHGPYQLGGYSYGGVVVYEMARQLLEAGEEIAFLALFDTVNPATPGRKYSYVERVRVFWDSQRGKHPLVRLSRILARVGDGIRTHVSVKAEVDAAGRAGTTEPHSRLRGIQLREAHLKSVEQYRPPPLACGGTLFKSTAVDDKFEFPSDYGWSEALGRLEIVPVPGRHLTLFSPEHVATLAAEVLKRLS